MVQMENKVVLSSVLETFIETFRCGTGENEIIQGQKLALAGES